MAAPPTAPRYARPTAAWKARITPERASVVQYTARLKSRQPSRLLLISPQDPSRPCYFSRLPRELRLQIYEYILHPTLFLGPASLQYIRGMKQRVKPALLHVCGLIRLEVAALLYGSTHITYKPSDFNFQPLEHWLSTIPAEHVAYLADNRNLSLVLNEYFSQPIPKERLALCERFGNRYGASSKFLVPYVASGLAMGIEYPSFWHIAICSSCRTNV
jgi:hypothetical protein